MVNFKMADMSGVSLSTLEKLDGTNYVTWSFKIKIFLKAKGWLKAITENPPAEAAALETWQKMDAEVMNIIVQSLTAQQAIYIINENTAKDAWNKLAERYQGDIDDKKIFVRRELSNVHWKRDDTAEKYISRIENLGATLTNLGQPLTQAELSSYVLNGLPNHYKCVKRIFEAMRPSEVTIKQIKNSLLAEENSNRQEEMSATTAYNTKQNKWQKKRCFNCGRQNHLQKDCWFLKPREKPGNENKDYRNYRSYGKQNVQDKNIRSKHKANKLENENVEEESKEEENNEAENKEIQRTGYNFIDEVRKDEQCNQVKQVSSWTIDSGATCHMTREQDILENFIKKDCGTVKLADGSNKRSVGVGNVTLQQSDEDDDYVNIKNVLCVPELDDNLLSISKLDEAGMMIQFKEGKCLIFKDDKIVFSANNFNGLYTLNAVTVTNEQLKIVKGVDEDELWHKRFGHLNYEALKEMSDKEIIRGLKMQNSNHEKCEACIMGKSTRSHFKDLNRPLRNDILELVHVDLVGPISPESLGHSKYILIITDDCSRKVKIYFMKKKSETAELIIEFIQEAERETGKMIKIMRSDNGTEFVNETIKGFFKKKGIKHELTIPYTPEQNGTAERMNRTLLEMTRTILIDSKLPKNFWAEAMATAVYIRNRCGARKLNGKTPEEIWTGKRPTSSHFKIFGCLAYSWIPKELRNKLDRKATPAIFIGYYENMKAYKLYDPMTKKIFSCKKPIFFENKSGWEELHKRNEDKQDSSINKNTEDKAIIMWKMTEEDRNNENRGQNNPINEIQAEQIDHEENRELERQNQEEDRRMEERRQDDNLRRSERRRQAPDRLEINPRLNSYCNKAVKDKYEPNDYKEATSCKEKEKWKVAIEKELNSLNKMKTWQVVKKENHMNVLKSKWVFKIKRGDNGEQKYKARLVAVGYYQKKGRDFLESYSPVMRLTSLRIILAIANIMNMELRQLDVETAYLHGNLTEEVYMEIPDGCDFKRENYCCQLKKSIYGLKQSGRAWNKKLDEELKAMGFIQLETDKCIYIKNNEDGEFAILGAYVDDLILATTKTKLMNDILKELSSKFAIKDLGEPNNMLGMRIKRNRKENIITLDQNEYIQKLLDKFNMQDAKGSTSPMEISLKLEKSNVDIEENIPYQSLIGALMYLVQGSRPDITYAVHYLSQFNDCYSKLHWTHLKRVLRYLKATPDTYIRYKCDPSIIGYTDASWNNSVDGKSVSGYLFLLGGAPVSWTSNKQPIIALSTCEAEFVGLCEAVKEAKWIRNFLTELHLNEKFLPNDFLIFSDNQAAISIINNNLNYSKRSKHIDLKYLYTRNEIEDGNIKINYIPTNMMAADGLTKALSPVKVKKLNKLIGMEISLEN